MKYKINFARIKREMPVNGIYQKCFIHGSVKFRIAEYTKEMKPHWCSNGHKGYVLEGEMDIEFRNKKISFRKGDGLYIPAGNLHKHKARVITDIVRIIYIDNL